MYIKKTLTRQLVGIIQSSTSSLFDGARFSSSLVSMAELIFDKWLVEYDANATHKAYESITVGGADECTCIYCRNFTKVRAQFFTAETLSLLARLGIDYTKDVEAYEMGQVESGLSLYGVWYYFVGRVEEKFAIEAKTKGYFSINFAPATGAMAAESFANQPLGEVTIINEAAWLLNEAYE